VRKVLVLVRKEFLQRVRGKGFWIGTLALPIVVVGLSFLPGLFMHLSQAKEQRVALVDLTGRLREASVLQRKGDRYRFHIVEVDSASLATVRGKLLDGVREEEYDAVVVVPAAAAIETSGSFIELYAKSVSGFEKNEAIRSRVSEAIVEIRLIDRGLEPQLVQELTRELRLRTFKVSKRGAQARSGGAEFLLIYLLVFSLYMTMIFYGTFVMRAVIEEKSSRAVEIILSLVRPGQLMAGKILGVGSVGLLQYVIWILTLVVAFMFGAGWVQGQLGPGMEFPSLSPLVIFSFLLFFILGYLLYSTLWAALGAMVSSESEAQQLQFPLVMLLVVPFLAMFYVINAPHTTLSVVLSLIPFFAPILMFVRIAVDPPSLAQILVSIGLLLATLWISVWAVGRIFRVGILMVGKRATLPEVMRWLRYG